MKEPNPADIDRIDPGAAERQGPSPALIGFLVLVAVLIAFVALNGRHTKIDFVVSEVDAPVWVCIAVSMVLGVLAERLFIAFWRRRGR